MARWLERIGRAARRAAGQAVFLAACVVAWGMGPARAGDEPGRFDFWVLSLSWSPSYCEAQGDQRRDQQCARPFAFVVHGLWPQYDRGYPRNCPDSAGRLPDRLIRDQLDIFPAFGLVIHEWRSHGTCSGLTPADYFKATRKAFDKIIVPADYQAPREPRMVDVKAVEEAFLAANKDLDRNEIAISCDDRRLREVQICFSKDLSQFRACPEVDRKACRRDRVYMPAIRAR